VKATRKDFSRVAPRAASQAKVFYFCGPDESGANDAANRIVALLPDAGERVDLSGAELRRDPVRLGDEARSISLFGTSRHILVRASGDEAHDAVEILLEHVAEACPVLIVASGATDKSRTAKLLAGRNDALVAMFYPPDPDSMAQTVRQLGDAAGLRIPGDLAMRIARGCGLDSRLAQAEIAKLALYLDAGPQTPRALDAETLDAVGATTEDDGFRPIVAAVLGGEAHRLPDELRRMRELGLNPVGVLLAFERRAVQLAQLAARLGPRGDITSFMKGETAARRVFFKEEREISDQLRKWRGQRLERLLVRIGELHRALMANSQQAELLLAQGLADITRAAASR